MVWVAAWAGKAPNQSASTPHAEALSSLFGSEKLVLMALGAVVELTALVITASSSPAPDVYHGRFSTMVRPIVRVRAFFVDHRMFGRTYSTCGGSGARAASTSSTAGSPSRWWVLCFSSRNTSPYRAVPRAVTVTWR